MRTVATLESFDAWAGSHEPAAIQALDLRDRTAVLRTVDPEGCLFLACPMEREMAGMLVGRGAIVVPTMPGCFTVHRNRLYTAEELFDAYDRDDDSSFERTLDQRVYQEYLEQGRDRPPRIDVSFARALHDHSITEALDDALEGERVVAVMGGHGLHRADDDYREVVRLSKTLTERGYVIVTGGGPGAMEAAHLGAWLAHRPAIAIDEVLGSAFVRRPDGATPGTEYDDACWLRRAFDVRERWPLVQPIRSIGIPTWLYGHEPPTPFATQIAKYFANAIREEGLLALATHGVIFAPGSAGTTQEIFQDACQNHYGTQGHISPMILLGRAFWTEHRPVWPLLEHVSARQTYGELVALVDCADEVVAAIQDYEPSWYQVTSDPDARLETHLRHDLRLRGNIVIDVAGEAELDAIAEGPLPDSAFADWFLEIVTDNWVQPDALQAALVHLDGAVVYRAGEHVILKRDDTYSRWQVTLDD